MGMYQTVAAASLAICSGALAQHVEVFPTLPHAASNIVPFGQTPGTTVHQVFASTLFSAHTGGKAAVITEIAFAPTGTGTLTGNLTVRLGYTSTIPGQLPTAGGLNLPDINGGGAPNAAGPMDLFYDAPTQFAVVGPDPQNFQLVLQGPAFEYHPALGNLLMEIVITGNDAGFACSRSAGSAEASRSYRRHDNTTSLTPTQAHRTRFTFADAPACYPDCNHDGVLNLADFGCFGTQFALGQPYADCNGDGVRNLSDFGCFQTKFALGCP